MDTKKELNKKIEKLSQNLYVIFDKVKEQCEFATLNYNDVDFVRCNLPIIHQKYQLQDIEVYNFGPIDKFINQRSFNKVDWSCYRFETEAENLARLGMTQNEIEAYFAEKSKKNRGMTEEQIISVMKNYIAQKHSEE